MAKKIFRLKIILDDILPQIWRLIEVESNITFYEFHLIIQEAMGWTNSHLHEFTAGNFRIGDRDEEACEFGNPPEWEERDKKLSDYFSENNTKVDYTYDFGDNWEHTIMLESIESKKKGIKYPRCINGERACPPDDCGSSPGYYRLLKILSDSKHDEYESMKTWAGDFEPEHFDKEEATQGMQNPVDLSDMLEEDYLEEDVLEFVPERKWDNLPPETQKMILDSVYCGQCKDLVTMINFSRTTQEDMEILKGKCSVCSHDVVRTVN
ncbi:MAG: plasmid pRiA4b ORF-3 family protein [Candidatus Aceula meridiana]|nr:plasmid pRiA4b ORF-3 family protein [Candidatus Aceula meridiana]